MESKAELLSLQQVRCFCAALELGSFTAAAAALRVSQPAVAEQIRKLEQILGTELFVRAGRGVLPTDAARAFAEHATRSLRALEDAADSVGELTSLKTRDRRRVGVFSGPLAWRFELLVAAFLREHPQVTVRLIGRNSAAIVDRVRDGELEAGLVLLPIDDERLDVRPIVRDEVLYVSADARRTREPATIEALASVPLVFYDAESADADPIRRQLAERAQAMGVQLRPRVEVELIDIALRLVAAGVGDTYLPSAYTRAPYYPDGPAHDVVPARALRHVRDRHALRRTALPRRPRAARGAGDAHACGGRRVRPLSRLAQCRDPAGLSVPARGPRLCLVACCRETDSYSTARGWSHQATMRRDRSARAETPPGEGGVSDERQATMPSAFGHVARRGAGGGLLLRLAALAGRHVGGVPVPPVVRRRALLVWIVVLGGLVEQLGEGGDVHG